MNESVLLQHIYERSTGAGGAVVIPPGDDMGAVSVGGGVVLITVDQVVEGVHFAVGTPLGRVGRKAITRNISDVAAMAAKPTAAVAAALLPRSLPDAEASALFDAMRDVATSLSCPLVGGDISAHGGPLVLSVTVLAEPAGIAPVRRSTARVGDAVWVTGELGGSLLEDDGGYVHHLDFTPRVDAARALAGDAATRPTAMIDLSDGIGIDLARVCDASGVSAEVEVERLPVRGVARAAAERRGVEPWRPAVGDGEDYELLLTLPAGVEPAVSGLKLTRVGRVVERGDAAVRWLADGHAVEIDAADAGWEHRG